MIFIEYYLSNAFRYDAITRGMDVVKYVINDIFSMAKYPVCNMNVDEKTAKYISSKWTESIFLSHRMQRNI
jgi:hypothetical protein